MESSEDVLRELFAAPENTVCFECKASPVNSASVAYGIFLCDVCGDLLSSVAFTSVKSLPTQWPENELLLMRAGGNLSLQSFLSQYEFPEAPFPFNFQTRASEYYRGMLEAHSRGEESSVSPPSHEEGILLVSSAPVEEEKTGLKDKVYEGIRHKFGEFTSNPSVKKIEEKYSEMVAKGREWTEKPEVQKFKEKTVEAYGYVATKTKEAFLKVRSHPKVIELNQNISKKFNEAAQAISAKFRELMGWPAASNS